MVEEGVVEGGVGGGVGNNRGDNWCCRGGAGCGQEGREVRKGRTEDEGMASFLCG